MKCNVKGAKIKKVTEAYYTVGNSVLAYLDASLGSIVTDQYGYKRKRLQEMYDTTHRYLGYMMDRHGDEDIDNKARAENARKECTDKLLAYAGFDFDAATSALLPDDVFSRTWHDEDEIKKHIGREKFIANMEPVAQTYHAEVLHWFWLHKAFGHDRLTNLYTLLRQDYNVFVTEYLRCKAAGDHKIQNILKERQDRLADIGMEFVEV